MNGTQHSGQGSMGFLAAVCACFDTMFISLEHNEAYYIWPCIDEIPLKFTHAVSLTVVSFPDIMLSCTTPVIHVKAGTTRSRANRSNVKIHV
jgi:aminopeptidase N